MRTPLVKGEDGKSYIELTNQEDELERRLNPATGTEADNFWSDAQPQVPPPPLLDLDVVWSNIGDGTPISAPNQSGDVADEDIHAQNAAILVKELKYYLLASGPRPPVADKSPPQVDDKQNGNVDHENSQSDEPEAGLKSVYGACILVKLQFEDREVQKQVPDQDYVQLGEFIASVTQNVETLLSKDPVAAQAVIDGIAFELTPILMSRMLDGLETEVDVLQNACFDLLKLCSKYASPKEMHMALLGFMQKIDKTYMQATCYLVYRPLTILWTETLLRFPKKRHAFLLDFVKWFDKAASESEGYESIGVSDDGRGAEQSGLCDGVNDIAINFYASLAKVQSNHCMSDSSLGECVDALSAALSTFSMSKQKSITKDVEKVNSGSRKENDPAGDKPTTETKTEPGSAPQSGGDGKDKEVTKEATKGSETTKESSKCSDGNQDPYLVEAKDLVNERAVTLAQALKLQSVVWGDMATPKGEEDKIPKRLLKEKRAKSKKEEEAEYKLYTLLQMMHGLGWTNPAMVCQIACRGLHLDLMKEGEHLIRDHIGDDVRTKKEVKHSLYSASGIGLFVCGWLRCSSRLSEEESVDKGFGYEINLSGSGFDLLEPEYAFDLALPYLEAIVGQSTISTCLAGIVTIRALLLRLQGVGFATMEQVLRVRCGTRAIGREVSVLGLALHMGRALSLMDDPKHRTFVYETLQMVIEMCRHPMARYCVVECLLHESIGVPVTAQFVTELKDAIRYSDSIAWDGKEDSHMGMRWSRMEAEELKTRFIQLVSGLYLTPCQKMLGKVQGIAATIGSYVYVAGSDERHLEMCAKSDSDDVRREIEKRRELMRAYIKLGREIVRALASVAEHDQKNLPGSQMAKEAVKEAKTVFRASVQTLNSCVATLGMVESVVDKLG